MSGAYYNEIDPFAAQWLRNLIAAGHIAPGEVDERSIVEIQPDDLRGFTQCHFFAGIGGWSYALRLAGWDDSRPVWTGSCPCQPFSAAGKGKGAEDERHLWPHFFRLIRECRPVTCFGEQVASKDALAWLDHVSTDLEGEAYTVGAVDTCAAGFGAPHIRQRIYWVADTGHDERSSWAKRDIDQPETSVRQLGGGGGVADFMAYAGLLSEGRSSRSTETKTWRSCGDASGCGEHGILGHSDGKRLQGQRADNCQEGWSRSERPPGLSDRTIRPGAVNGFWADAEWIACRDGKARPTEPGVAPLAHGAPSRVGRLRGYGNAIVAPQAAAFVRAFLEVSP